MIQFFVIKMRDSNAVVIVGVAGGREEAKKRAFNWLGRNPDNYIIEPITSVHDRVHIDVTVQV